MSDSDDEELQKRPQLVDDNAGLHPLFWDAVPENAEDDAAFQALKAIDEELSPEERAVGFKSQGNNKLKLALSDKADAAAKRTLLRDAVRAYDEGLLARAQDDKLNALLHANRAQAHLLLGNYRKALQDSQAAHKLDPSNIKAVFRGARASLHLGQWQVCADLCAAGRKLDPATKDFDALEKQAQAKLDEARQLAERQAAQREAETAPARALAEAITRRGYKLTRPQVRLEDRSRPVLDASGQLVWPALLMYPENMSQDAVQAFGEEDTFNEHLDMMFGPDAPPLEWDQHGEYTRQRVELYYLAHAGKALTQEQLVDAMQGRWPEGLPTDTGPQRYGDRAARMRRVDPSHTLRQVLSAPDHFIPGIPLFWVVAKGTPYAERFLAEGA